MLLQFQCCTVIAALLNLQPPVVAAPPCSTSKRQRQLHASHSSKSSSLRHTPSSHKWQQSQGSVWALRSVKQNTNNILEGADNQWGKCTYMPMPRPPRCKAHQLLPALQYCAHEPQPSQQAGSRCRRIYKLQAVLQAGCVGHIQRQARAVMAACHRFPIQQHHQRRLG